MRVEPALAAALLAVHLGCGSDGGTGAPAAASGEAPALRFREEATARGLRFTHWNGMTGERTLGEIMGSGVGLLDYDGDGDLDVYLAQGAPLRAGDDPAASLAPPPPEMLPLGDRLYRNELVPAGALRFTDVTATAGIAGGGYGMGVATGDVDADGDVDVFTSRLGPDRLWRNRGDGTFEDATAAAGLGGDDRWGASASFADYDGDGALDLYVTNYVAFDIDAGVVCRNLTGAVDYCGPLAYPAEADRLWRNRGDGTFEDVSARAGIAAVADAGLGVVAGDFDGDGRVDFYVANDGMANRLWLQRDGGVFRDEATTRGAALSHDGQAEAGMGIAAADVDADGDEDLLVTHLALETNRLYRAGADGFFDDGTIESGLGAPSLPHTGFGVAWLDGDLDGLLDLATANGGVKAIPEREAAGDLQPLAMPDQLFHHLEGGRFREVAGAFPPLATSRGLAVGDLDHDGDPDLVVSTNAGPALLWRNESARRGRWLGLRLTHGDPPRDALGAVVAVERPGRPTLWRRVRTDGSYLSARDPRLLVGLGDAEATAVVVRWPDGARERFHVAADAYHTLHRGDGEAVR